MCTAGAIRVILMIKQKMGAESTSEMTEGTWPVVQLASPWARLAASITSGISATSSSAVELLSSSDLHSYVAQSTLNCGAQKLISSKYHSLAKVATHMSSVPSALHQTLPQ